MAEESRSADSTSRESGVMPVKQMDEPHHSYDGGGNETQADHQSSTENAGSSIHTHTLSEEMTSVMKQMNELQSRYDRLLANKTNGLRSLPLPPSTDSAAEPDPLEIMFPPTAGFNLRPQPDTRASMLLKLQHSTQANTNTSAEPPPEKRWVSEIRYTGWEGFKNVILEDRKEHAIDVLLGSAKFYWQRHVDSRRETNQEEGGASQLSPAELLKAQKEMPERVRVNSLHILASLREVAPEHFGRDLEPTVFLRPYKLFSTYEKELRQYWKDIKSRLPEPSTNSDDILVSEPLGGGMETVGRDQSTVDAFDPPQAGQEDASAGQKPSFDGPKDTTKASIGALHDLGCLLDFMDQYISPVTEAYRSASLRQVRFRDLWHLYKPGDEIVCLQDLYTSKSKAVAFATIEESKGGEPALWRVLQVSSGRPVLCSPIRKEKDQFQGSNRVSTLIPPTVRAPAVKCNTFKILCYMLGYDGSKFGPIYHNFEIKPFEGLQDVASLELIPCRLYDYMHECRSRLKSRGMKFMTTTVPAHFVYTGQTLMHHPGGQRCPIVRRTQHIDSSVIVDFKEAYSANPKWVIALAIPEAMGGSGPEITEDFPVSYWDDKEQKQLAREEEDEIHDDNDIDETLMADFIAKDGFLSSFQNKISNEDVDGSSFGDTELVLLPDRVVAFDLHSRRYNIVGVDGLQTVEVKSEGWGDLKLPRGHKKMVQAQVEMHFREKETRQRYPGRQGDLVRGKGQGLIILLHGAPGTGKTSTAECVAEFLRRPLYPITCGDLGITAQEVEETLSEAFARAEAWDCVLLLDEADVFLAQRTRTDLKRNAVVSVFLRVLEYYKGILFLTTNRVGAFDEAFKSRIHLHLYYPILNKDQTMSIWQMNLDRLNRQRGDALQVDHDAILRYAEAHFDYHKQKNTRWNGRQIHNAFQTAAALAEYEALETNKQLANLDVSHFKTVADASHQFDRYISETIGGSDADRALNDRERSDNFRWPSYQKEFDIHAGQSANARGAYQTPPRQWADHDPRVSFQPSTSRPPHFDMADFEEFQRQKYLRQFSGAGGSNPMPPSPMPKPWPRPEDEGAEETTGLHRVSEEDLERSWHDRRAPAFNTHPPQDNARHTRPSEARNAPQRWED